MYRFQIGMALVLTEFGIDLISDTNYREKKNGLYIAHASGVRPDNAHWRWHYSGRIAAEGLFDDFCTIQSEYADVAGWELAHTDRIKLQRVRPLVAFDDLELLTSTHFLLTRQQAKDGGDVRAILRRFERVYDQRTVDAAVWQLDEYSLLGND